MGLVEAVKSGAAWLRSLVVSLSAAPPVVGTEPKPANPLVMALVVLLAGGLPAALEYLSHSGYGLVLVGGVSILAYIATVVRNKLAGMLASVVGINVEVSYPEGESKFVRTELFKWSPTSQPVPLMQHRDLLRIDTPAGVETAEQKGDRLAREAGLSSPDRN
jgi:hypothetical protein